MAVKLYLSPTNNNLQYTLNSGIGASDTSLTLSSSVAGIVQAPGVLVIDRVDASGNKTPTTREYISFTGVAGAVLSGCTRGLAGSTGQSHSVGAVVEFVPDVTWSNGVENTILQEHTANGQHASLASTSFISTLAAVVLSVASVRTSSIVQDNVQNLMTTSLASLQQAYVTNLLSVSGASLSGTYFIRPTWFMSGTLSGASKALGSPIAMPQSGSLLYAYVTARIGASQASLSFDIQKNGSSVIASSNVLTIPINGTFASTASIATLAFNATDTFAVGPANVSSFAQDVTLVLVAR